jgi:hypothetical protein
MGLFDFVSDAIDTVSNVAGGAADLVGDLASSTIDTASEVAGLAVTVARLPISPLYNVAEGIVDACRDQVQPEIGSVLYCDLALGYMDHSGIYIGNNEIVHLSGKGHIEIVSPKQFINGTTACSIYVSCRGTSSVGSAAAAKLARDMVGTSRNYNFILDNCHQFCAGCLTGDFENACNFLWMLKHESEKQLGSDTWRFWDIDL